MAQSEAVSGVDSFLVYAEESAYGTDPGSGYAQLGLVNSFKPSVNNETQYFRSMSGTGTAREATGYAAGKHVSNASVEFTVNDWAFMKYVLGTESGSGPYTYSAATNPASLTFHHCINNPGSASTDQDLILLGGMVDSCTIRCAVGEPVTCTLNILAAYQMYDTTILLTVAPPSDDVFTFSGVTLELPDSTSVDNIIDSVEITIKNNPEILFGLGSRLGQNAKAKQLEYEIRFTVKYLDNDLMEKLQGAATPTAAGTPTKNATFAVKFTNGTQSADFVFTNFVIDEGTLNADMNQVLGQDIKGTGWNLIVTDDRT